MSGSGEPGGSVAADLVEAAAGLLRAGGVVAAPTETLVGLLADAASTAALDRLVRLKGRPPGQPLPILIPDAGMLLRFAESPPPLAFRAAERLWPGPVTLILRARAGLPGILIGSDGTVAMRVAGPSPAFELCRRFEGALTATSANLSGVPAVSDTEALDPAVRAAVDLVVPGRSGTGTPSTLLAVGPDGWRILREGAVSARAIQEALE